MEIGLSVAKIMTDTERDSIQNSIETLASTPYGTAPFIRNMGIKNYPPQSASDIDRNSYVTEVITQAGKWEDRAKVSEVKFENENGIKVVIENV